MSLLQSHWCLQLSWHRSAPSCAHKAALPLGACRTNHQRVQIASRRQRQAHGTTVRASKDSNNNSNSDKDEEPNKSSSSGAGIPAGLFLFVGSLAYTLTNMREELTDVLYNDDTLADIGVAGFGLGDIVGALLWATALWYVSPLQLLLVFLGKFDTDRPSDWIINKLGKAAGNNVEAIDYVAPLWTRASAGATCLLGGVAASVLLESGLGDPTWAVSSGIGALFAAAVFEVGRPKRLTVAEAQQLEAQWQDFAAFADRRLQRSGRCHESEVYAAFRRTSGRYRSTDTLSDSTLKDMVRNWHPGVERTRTGYLKNVSLRKPVTPGTSSSSVRSSVDEDVGSPRQQQQVSGAGDSPLLDSIVAQQRKEQQELEPEKQEVTVISAAAAGKSIDHA